MDWDRLGSIGMDWDGLRGIARDGGAGGGRGRGDGGGVGNKGGGERTAARTWRTKAETPSTTAAADARDPARPGKRRVHVGQAPFGAVGGPAWRLLGPLACWCDGGGRHMYQTTTTRKVQEKQLAFHIPSLAYVYRGCANNMMPCRCPGPPTAQEAKQLVVEADNVEAF